MLGIPIGLLYANFSEAMFHRYVLHGLGKNPKSFWAFHWHEHHREARRNAFRDDNYLRSPWAWHSLSKERLAIAASVALHLPLLPVAPYFVGTLVYCAVKYHRVHARAHLDPEWGRQNVPWHYDHHMAPNQNANWGIVRPWYDQIMGTRLPYSGTPAERPSAPRAAKQVAATPSGERSSSQFDLNGPGDWAREHRWSPCVPLPRPPTRAHLEEAVLPAVPMRQWVCSPPWKLRYVLGYDRELCGKVLGAFVGEVVARSAGARSESSGSRASAMRSREQ